MAYRRYIDATAEWQIVYRWSSNGSTWNATNETIVWTGGEEPEWRFVSIDIDSQDRIHLSFITGANIYYTRSDNGVDWIELEWVNESIEDLMGVGDHQVVDFPVLLIVQSNGAANGAVAVDHRIGSIAVSVDHDRLPALARALRVKPAVERATRLEQDSVAGGEFHFGDGRERLPRSVGRGAVGQVAAGDRIDVVRRVARRALRGRQLTVIADRRAGQKHQ